LRQGVLKVIEDTSFSPSKERKYVVADMLTGYGVAESIRHYYSIWGGTLTGKKVIVQGWGNVGSAAAYYLAQSGAIIVGIIDRVGGLMNENGFSFDEVKALFLSKNGNELNHPDLISYDEVNERIWDLKADVFIPCAGSRMITENQLDRMVSAGVSVISCGANVPFADPEIFFGKIAEKADSSVSLIPDFIANCGMARVFAYLMSNDLDSLTDEGIFNDTSTTIQVALNKAYKVNQNKTGLARTAFEQALEQLVN
jgi:glutamate dehydrogenase/leucine dehydrogenase